MKVAVVAPEPVPHQWGGTERAVESMRRAISGTAGHEADVVKLAVDESNLPALIDAYRRFAELDLSDYDRVVSVKYPAWMIDHPHHVVHMFHPLRGLYDAYEAFGLPLVRTPRSTAVAGILELIGHRNDRVATAEFFDRFEALVRSEGPDAPDLEFPGPFARAVVHWLDHIALTPPRTRAHFAISAAVASRPEYVPRGIRPLVLPLPSDLPAGPPDPEPGDHLFTASRLATPKRIDLLIDAMTYVHRQVRLVIAGTGPEEAALRERARADPRIEFPGFVDDDDLIHHYRTAIAVPFVPDDEDQGLIAVEAATQGTPLITCVDSGGPAEFVVDGVTGLIAEATPEALGRALERVVDDPVWARRMGVTAARRTTVQTWTDTVRMLLGTPDRPPPARLEAPSPTRGRLQRPRAVVLATYGIDEPRHGGQLRVHHLCRSLAKDLDVDLVALVADAAETTAVRVAPGVTSTTVRRSVRQAAVEDDLGRRLDQPVTDILAGVDAHLTPTYLERVRERIDGAALVILAQPFLYPVLSQVGSTLPFVVDTQNVEIDLRSQTLGDLPAARPVLETLRRVEGDALTAAAAVTACSTADADRLADLYDIDRAAVTIIPNGTVVPRVVPDRAAREVATRKWLDRFHWNRGAAAIRHLGVFFGSWHPPNLDAAEFLIEIARRRPDLFIVSAGHHGLAFGEHTLPANLVFPGTVTSTTKAALLGCASVALNPMRTGSGTNLKLLEFLGHGVPTVSTPFGARGVEVTDGRELLVAAPDDFADAIARVFAHPARTAVRVRAGRRLAERYRWDVIGDTYRRLVTTLA